MLSRRTIIRTGTMALLGLCMPTRPARATRDAPYAIGRVTFSAINVYSRASFDSERLSKRSRDELLPLLEEIRSTDGPAHNPLWYRIAEGFIHSGYVQYIPQMPINSPLERIPAGGLLAQVTVPYTRTFYAPRGGNFQPLYRLYYESLHWVRDVVSGPDGCCWYRLYDPKIEVEYFVPAVDLRPILPEEYTPLAREVAPESKRIAISIEQQTLTAYENDKVVLQTTVSSGLPSPADLPDDEIPTDTPLGYFRITLKMPSRHMGDGRLTSQVEAYELPGVPWTMAFHETGAALHGSYWHNHFGRKMSHGCVNLRNTDALWLFRWSDPPFETTDWYVQGNGTLVQVF
jgi:hypothetical protein